MRRSRLIVLILLALIGGGCSERVKKTAPTVNPLDIELLRAMSNAGALQPLNPPPVQRPELVSLGRMLFFDKILSGNKDVSCASCHQPSTGTVDKLPLSFGTDGSQSARNARPLYNLGYLDHLFWDGRVEKKDGTFHSPAGEHLPPEIDSAAAAQVMITVTNRSEMRGRPGDIATDGTRNELAALADDDFPSQWDGLMKRLLAIPEYVTLFESAYPKVPRDKLGFHHAANAIAAFEISAFSSTRAPFDQYLAGNDAALTEEQKRGGLLFYGRARCGGCHRGPLFTDSRFHNLAIPQLNPVGEQFDLGRFTVTGKATDRFAFKTPSLRNVALTGPWGHDGTYSSLKAIVEHYRNPERSLLEYDASQLPPQLRPLVRSEEQLDAGMLETLSPVAGTTLELSDQEITQLIAFLTALTDPEIERPNITPKTVPSGLLSSKARAQ